MDGVPLEDIQRHYDGLPLVPYTKSKLIIGDSSILPILAAQKASVAMQLAESKNMTVQGEITGVPVVGTNAMGINATSPVITSSAMSVVSPPIPVSTAPVTVDTQQTQAHAQAHQAYWQYMMPQYYGNSSVNSAGAYNQNQYAAAAYAQYYQAYYAAQQAQAQSLVQNQEVRPVDTAGSVNNTTHTTDLIIPPYVDPNTNKPIPGTIFTVPSLDRSLEEIRSELKKYKK